MANNQEEVILLGAVGSPYVCRVKIALKLKEVQYKFLEENLANKSELLLKSNPVHKKVPVFIHNEKPIAESLVADAAWKAVFTADEKEREKNVDQSFEALQFLENELKDKKFFREEEFGLVDISGIFVAFWIPIVQEVVGLKLLNSEKFPKLNKWCEEFTNHPVVKELLFVLPHSRKSKRRFHSLVPQVENVVVRVDYLISDYDCSSSSTASNGGPF
ncbi:hypothetical protein JHK86_018537 [Glycine max]|nr:hypothetical protein JHK86_018537 [Glycine max]